MRIGNEGELRNLVMTLGVAATFTTTTNKGIKRKLEVGRPTKIVTSLGIGAAPVESVMKQLNKKSRPENSLLSRSALGS